MFYASSRDQRAQARYLRSETGGGTGWLVGNGFEPRSLREGGSILLLRPRWESGEYAEGFGAATARAHSRRSMDELRAGIRAAGAASVPGLPRMAQHQRRAQHRPAVHDPRVVAVHRLRRKLVEGLGVQLATVMADTAGLDPPQRIDNRPSAGAAITKRVPSACVPALP